MDNIQGFKVLHLYFSSESTSGHTIFLKQHSARSFDEEKPPDSTLFVINLPPYTTSENLEHAFSCAGPIRNVYIQDAVKNEDCEVKSNGFKIGYIVFSKPEILKKALSLQSLNPLSTDKNRTIVGLSKWITEYNSSIENHKKLNELAIEAVKKTDAAIEKSEKTPNVDDDGWTVVTRKGRNPGIAHKESVENKIIEKSKKKSEKKQLKNFYTFQIKEQKMKNIIALRKSFEESKEKVNLMKKMRNFKPL